MIKVNEDSVLESLTTSVSVLNIPTNQGSQQDNETSLSSEERVEKVFEDIGGCGLFQVVAYLAIALGMSAPSWFIYELGFLTQEPTQFVCTYYEQYTNDSSDICTKENICADDPRIATWEADPDSTKTLNNFQ